MTVEAPPPPADPTSDLPCDPPFDLPFDVDLPGDSHLSGELPVDPLAQRDWDRFLDLLVAEGPPEEVAEDEWPPDGGPVEFPADLGDAGALGVLVAAAVPDRVSDLDGAAVAAALASVELGSLPDGGVVAVGAAASRLAGWAAGVELAATAELTRRAAGWRGVGAGGADVVVPELLSARDLAAAEVGAACGVSHQAGLLRVDLAADLVRLPGTRVALAGGRIDRAKAAAIAEAVAVLDDAAAAGVEARVLGRPRPRRCRP